MLDKEVEFVNKFEICRLATCYNNKPHVVPVCYIFMNGYFYIATDYNTRKYRNVKRNRDVALVIDTYKPNKALLIEGRAEILEGGEEFRDVYREFYKRFSWVRADPWKEGEAPFIKIHIIKSMSWGL